MTGSQDDLDLSLGTGTRGWRSAKQQRSSGLGIRPNHPPSRSPHRHRPKSHSRRRCVLVLDAEDLDRDR